MPPNYGPVGDFPVQNKIVVVTGGGSGIGLAFAEACLAKGAKVLVGDLKLTPEGKRFVEIHSSSGNVIFTECDVTKWADLRNLVNVSLQTWGEVPDVYAPVAGVFEPEWSNFWDDLEQDQGSYAQMRINADHPIKLTRIAIRALLGANKKGVVCLVASGAGLGGIYLSALYCATKHAVVGLAKSLTPADAEEGVKVVCICPGLVLSPLLTARKDGKEDMLGFHGADAKNNAPILMPADIADAMLRLVEQSQYCGGTVLSKRAQGVVDVPGGESIAHDGGKAIYATGGTFVQDLLAKERGVPWKA